MKHRAAKGFTAIACCTFCGSRNILRPPLKAETKCTVCQRILELWPEIDCPHCKAESIQILIGRDSAAGSFLMCSECHRQVADGIPLHPEFASYPRWFARWLADCALDLAAAVLDRRLKRRYQPRVAEAEAEELLTSWRAESHGREMERQGQARLRENDLSVYAVADGGEHLTRSRLSVLSRHSALLNKYGHYISAFMPVAHGKIYEDEYGDDIWVGAEKEIEKLINSKVFKSENIGIRDEFYSFEFLSRCEPAFGSEYSDCWLFDELYDRLKVYHEARMAALAGGENIGNMSGIEFEQWLIASIRQAGVLDVKPTKRTGDQGADIIVRQNRTIVIQAKCYQQSVSNSAVQEVHAAKIHYGADEAWVVTNSRFTRSAREIAKSTGVRLIDRSSFRDIGLFVLQACGAQTQSFEAAAGFGTCATARDMASVRENSECSDAAVPLSEFCLTATASNIHGATSTSGRITTSSTISNDKELEQNAAPPPATKSRSLLIVAGLVTFVIAITGFTLKAHYARERAEEGVRHTLAVWTSTTLSNELAGQVECYAPMVAPFFKYPRVTLQEVAIAKEHFIKTYPVVKKYSISNINLERVDSEKVIVSFDKSWEAYGSSMYAGSERESLELHPVGERWRIVAERELEIYWVRTK